MANNVRDAVRRTLRARIEVIGETVVAAVAREILAYADLEPAQA